MRSGPDLIWARSAAWSARERVRGVGDHSGRSTTGDTMDPNPENPAEDEQTPLEDDVPVYADRETDDAAGTEG